jgi:hypothetical protein
MAAVTLTLTGNNAGAVSRLGRAIQRAAASWDDNRVVGTLTVTDTATSVAPYTITWTTNAGQSITEVIG